MVTYNEIYIRCRKALREAGIEASALEARLLTACASGKTISKLMQSLSLYTSDEIAQEVQRLTQRRIEGEPAAYITGMWEFYGLPFNVSPDVLIPRMDTEVLVEKAIELIRGKNNSARVLDLCTGSGCIGCAIAKNMPASKVTLADISPAALDTARSNIRLNELSARVVCVEADARKAPPMRMGTFDMLVSNPPYIETAVIETLDDSVKDYEPHLALDGGEDGLEFYRSICEKWVPLLQPGGFVLFEVGEGQADSVKEIMENAGVTRTGTIKDTLEIDRVVYGTYFPLI